MAINVRGWWVLKVAVADDTQGVQVRHTSIGIKRDSAVPATEDTWAQVLANVNEYLAVLGGVIDGVIVGWTLSRSGVWTGAIEAPETSENERKGVFPVVDVNGRKGSIEIPSLDEAVVIDAGVGAGLYMDPENAEVEAFIAKVIDGVYLVPRDGVVIATCAAGKKYHRTSGWVRERAG